MNNILDRYERHTSKCNKTRGRRLYMRYSSRDSFMMEYLGKKKIKQAFVPLGVFCLTCGYSIITRPFIDTKNKKVRIHAVEPSSLNRQQRRRMARNREKRVKIMKDLEMNDGRVYDTK